MIDIDENRHEGYLAGKTVVVGATASISVYRLPDIIRELRREGAEVIVGASRETLELLGEKLLHWASEHGVIKEISGEIEHINLFIGKKAEVGLLVAPATYNFIGKAASGVADDVPSLFFSFALGNGNPVVMVPAMHEAMYSNSVAKRNMEELARNGVSFVPPRLAAEKAKISEPEIVVDYVCRSLGPNSLSGIKALVIGGAGSEMIDPVRSITNASTGLTGVWFCKNLFREGCNTIWYIGNSEFPVPGYVKHLPAKSMAEFTDRTLTALEELKPDIVLCPAALPDFRPEKQYDHKIDSDSDIQINLKRNLKLLEEIRKRFDGILVSFKLDNETPSARGLRGKEFIVYNSYVRDGSPFGAVKNDYTLITADEKIRLGKISKPRMTLEVIRRVMGELNG
ncbi:MAG TPA: bifunctional phosphopantothenoylcysteine decarboxylase/phosphopantothenate--cysteine ligase CoaBC [Thermoplasmataceae archaeon]|nr:bifunctional phosphopantothenoylcysteine decarboxylase/phosphopantothenate--cysteine ligase CoaBC [Thermoplasmataceae archaeon]